MQLLSLSYVCFAGAVLVMYFGLSCAGQNVLLLLASLAFCASWDYRGALLLVLSTALDFAIGRRLDWERPEIERRRAMWLSVILNVSILVAYKYGRVWLSPAAAPLSSAGTLAEQVRRFAPVGLSFYTLARITHTLDAFYRVIRPARSLLEFMLFVGFFPQLTSGPIERARNVLPQLSQRRQFDLDRTYQALWLIGLGLFKKVYLADHAGLIAKRLFDTSGGVSATATLLGLYAYAFQIYGDFAGYSDIARGTARLFGIEIVANFDAPYASANLAEYWKRWHISLSSFLEDYVHRPVSMALRNHGELGLVCAIWVTFLTSGLWHGTGWTFLVWGALHAAGLSVFALTRKLRKRMSKRVHPRLLTACARIVTFHYVCLGYLFFRAPSLQAAWSTLRTLAAGFTITAEVNRSWNGLLFYAAVSFLLDYLQRRAGDTFWIFRQQTWVRAVVYAAMLLCVLRLFAPSEDFIYAEF
jgi:D-alanyl-lipoteichoic acid acyltransferase DltB (MBOAT superfamily)